MALDDGEELVGVPRVYRWIMKQRLHVTADGRERGAQLMGDIGHEVRSHGFQPLDLGDVVKHQNRSAGPRASVLQAHGIDAKPSSVLHRYRFGINTVGKVERHNFLKNPSHLRTARDFDERIGLHLFVAYVEHFFGLFVDEQHVTLGIEYQQPFNHASEDRVDFFLLSPDLVDIVANLKTHLVKVLFQQVQFVRMA